MAMGCGLDSAIVDAYDKELLRVIKVIQSLQPEKESDSLLINIYKLIQEFEEFESLKYDKNNPEEVEIFKTAQILFNKNIYAHNYSEC
jgi:hypothetical protein